MKIISINVNGIRAAHRKGFFEWMQKEQADIVCVQELKAQPDQMTEDMCNPPGYKGYFFPAEKKGYSGVGIYTREAPEHVSCGLGWETADREGRYIQVDFPDLTVVSLYLPSGSSGDERQAVKFDFLDRFMVHLKDLRGLQRPLIICGDWNIVHKEIDIKNWRANQKNSGCLPEERAWLDAVFEREGFIDAFRVLNQEKDHYTWWSNRGQAWANNVGWRIDYHVVTPDLKDAIRRVDIYKEERFSDHAPLIIEYDLGH